jgi:hypothetical protein
VLTGYIIGAPVWRCLGEYVTLSKTYHSLPKQEAVAAPVTSTFFFLIAFLAEAFIGNVK